MKNTARPQLAAFVGIVLLLVGAESALATQIILLGNQVRVQPIERTADPVPDVKGRNVKGVVVDRGPSAVQVQPADIVLFGKYAGTELKLDGEEYVIVREDDIRAVLQP